MASPCRGDNMTIVTRSMSSKFAAALIGRDFRGKPGHSIGRESAGSIYARSAKGGLKNRRTVP
jgi:hypothetical protein